MVCFVFSLDFGMKEGRNRRYSGGRRFETGGKNKHSVKSVIMGKRSRRRSLVWICWGTATEGGRRGSGSETVTGISLLAGATGLIEDGAVESKISAQQWEQHYCSAMNLEAPCTCSGPMEQLSLATKDFSARNLIGQGKFGEVYKGLLQDEMLVAIKKRRAAPTQEFIHERRKEKLHKKIIRLEKQLDAKQAVELEIEQLRGA